MFLATYFCVSCGSMASHSIFLGAFGSALALTITGFSAFFSAASTRPGPAL